MAGPIAIRRGVRTDDFVVIGPADFQGWMELVGFSVQSDLFQTAHETVLPRRPAACDSG